MNNILRYKGYTGVFGLEEGDEALFGLVLGIQDVISFSGRDVEELTTSFHGSVEDYLNWCAERGKPPQRPYSGKLTVRIEPDLHRQAAVQAQAAGKSLNQWVGEIIRDNTRVEV